MQIREEFSLKEVLWYKIGGTAKYFLSCESREDVHEALSFIAEKKPKRLFICGTGSNLIFSDDYFGGAVIQIVSPRDAKDMTADGNTVTVFARTLLDDVILFAFEHHLIGLEWAGGLPGTVGAGVRGNVGAYGGEIKDSLLSAEVIDYSGDNPEVKTLTSEELQFVYRGSLIKQQKQMIVLSATFALTKSSSEEVENARGIYDRNKQHRKDYHPLEYPNCGSVFKNLRKHDEIEKVLTVYPDLREQIEKKWYGKIAVASLIERLGLKGYRVGDAQVSEKHALFIVNVGNATAKDVVSIIQKVQDTFQKTFGFQLEVEAEIVS